jgi:RNA polymerase sigma-70 factor (ECF subfamily)
MQDVASNAPEDVEAVRVSVLEAYKRHAGELSEIALAMARNRALAQDVLQETFLRYFLTRMHGDEIADERAWLGRVMRDLILDWKRSAQVQAAVTLEEADGAVGETPEDRDSGERRLTSVMRALRMLAPREQQCINLRARGLAYREIASAMHVDVGTVGALLNRAVRKLRRALCVRENMA